LWATHRSDSLLREKGISCPPARTISDAGGSGRPSTEATEAANRAGSVTSAPVSHAQACTVAITTGAEPGPAGTCF
jgi:hypothetical protein